MVATSGKGWCLAPSLIALMNEVDARWPRRPKGYDGSIGDAAHAARGSEHNPDRDSDPMPLGTVSAVDITKHTAAMVARLLDELIGDPRVWYVIHDGFIYSRTHGWAKRAYDGPNPHTHHLHVSLVQSAKAAGDTARWLGKPAPAPKPVVLTRPAPAAPPFPGREAFRLNQRHLAVAELDRCLIRKGFDKHHDGNGYQPGRLFTEYTRKNVAAFQRSRPALAADADGWVGPLTWKALHS
jgi:hypothetical protein